MQREFIARSLTNQRENIDNSPAIHLVERFINRPVGTFDNSPAIHLIEQFINRPVGTFDNSPAIHRWELERDKLMSPVGTAETKGASRCLIHL